jgi:enoyl-CoA hydratase
MEIMGLRAAVRAGTEIQALGFHPPSAREYLKELAAGGLRQALETRDRPFGDYRASRGEE